MKCCTKCGVEKPLEDFYKDKHKASGYRSYCVECGRERARQLRLKSSDVLNARTSAWRAKNPDKAREAVQAWRERNPEANKAITAQWRNQNAHRIRQYNSTRRKGVVNATPPWFEKDAVANVYKKADEFGFEVDHIVPLLGKTVCGLHCWANLQLLDSKLNRSKNNREWPDMPS